MASNELLDRMDAVWKQMPAAARDAMNEYAADLARESLAATSEIARLRAALDRVRVCMECVADPRATYGAVCGHHSHSQRRPEAVAVECLNLRAELETAEAKLRLLE